MMHRSNRLRPLKIRTEHFLIDCEMQPWDLAKRVKFDENGQAVPHHNEVILLTVQPVPAGHNARDVSEPLSAKPRSASVKRGTSKSRVNDTAVVSTSVATCERKFTDADYAAMSRSVKTKSVASQHSPVKGIEANKRDGINRVMIPSATKRISTASARHQLDTSSESESEREENVDLTHHGPTVRKPVTRENDIRPNVRKSSQKAAADNNRSREFQAIDKNDVKTDSPRRQRNTTSGADKRTDVQAKNVVKRNLANVLDLLDVAEEFSANTKSQERLSQSFMTIRSPGSTVSDSTARSEFNNEELSTAAEESATERTEDSADSESQMGTSCESSPVRNTAASRSLRKQQTYQGTTRNSGKPNSGRSKKQSSSETRRNLRSSDRKLRKRIKPKDENSNVSKNTPKHAKQTHKKNKRKKKQTRSSGEGAKRKSANESREQKVAGGSRTTKVKDRKSRGPQSTHRATPRSQVRQGRPQESKGVRNARLVGRMRPGSVPPTRPMTMRLSRKAVTPQPDNRNMRCGKSPKKRALSSTEEGVQAKRGRKGESASATTADVPKESTSNIITTAGGINVSSEPGSSVATCGTQTDIKAYRIKNADLKILRRLVLPENPVDGAVVSTGKRPRRMLSADPPSGGAGPSTRSTTREPLCHQRDRSLIQQEELAEEMKLQQMAATTTTRRNPPQQSARRSFIRSTFEALITPVKNLLK